MSGDRAQNQAASVAESSAASQIKTSLQFPFMRNNTSSVSDVTEQFTGDITPSWHHAEMFVLNYVSEFQPSDNSGNKSAVLREHGKPEETCES